MDQQLFGGQQIELGLGPHSDTHRGGTQAGRDIRIAIDTPNLFDQIGLDRNIKACTRCDHRPAALDLGDLHAEPDQGVGNGFRFDIHTQKPRHSLMSQSYGLRYGEVVFRLGLADRTRCTADNLEHQRGRTLHSLTLQLRVHTSLEAMRGIGVQAVTSCLAGHGQRRKECGLKQDIPRGIGNARIFAAHDAGHRHGTLLIRNHQGIAAQDRLTAIEQRDLFTFIRHADADATIQHGQVEAVHRLPQFEHDVVGDIDHRRDGADTAAAQLLDHPVRRAGLGIDAAHHATQIARTGLTGLQRHRKLIIDTGNDRIDLWRRDRHTIEHTHLTRHTGQAEAIGTVGGQIDIDTLVVE